MKAQSLGFFGFRNIFIKDLNFLFKRLCSHTNSRIDGETFNACIDMQLNNLQCVTSSGVVHCGLSAALCKVPCEIIFYTPLKSAISGIEIVIKLNVKKNTQGKRRSYPYQASYEVCGKLPSGEIISLHNVPYIENLNSVLALASQILGVTSANLHQELRKDIELGGLGDVVILRSYSCNTGIELPVLPKESGVRLDCTPLLKDTRCPPFARYFPLSLLYDEELLKKLADLAQEEETPCKWEDYGHGKMMHHSYWALGHYLCNVFSRLADDQGQGYDALKPYNDKLCFCTGLLGRKSGNYIYGICSEKDEDNLYHSIQWVENDYESGRNPLLPQESENKNHGLPFPANWTRNPEQLICQYEKLGRLEERTNFTHILKHHPERLPPNFFRNISEIDNKVLDEQYARKAICDAIYVSRKKIQANYRYAIPGYYRGKITLQLPLCLGEAQYPNAYLVLLENKDGMYDVPTLLTPVMAYFSSRAITPQEYAAWEHNLFAQIDFEKSLPSEETFKSTDYFSNRREK